MEYIKPELAIFYNQVRLTVKGLGHQPSHKTFYTLSGLQSAGVQVALKLGE